MKLCRHQRNHYRPIPWQGAGPRQCVWISHPLHRQPAQFCPPLAGTHYRQQSTDVMEGQGIHHETGSRVDPQGPQPASRSRCGLLKIPQRLNAPASPSRAAATSDNHSRAECPREWCSMCAWSFRIGHACALRLGAGVGGGLPQSFGQQKTLRRGRQSHHSALSPALLKLGCHGGRIFSCGEKQWIHSVAAAHTNAGSSLNRGPSGHQPGARPGAVGNGPAA